MDKNKDAALAQPEPEPVAWTVGGLITDFSRDFSAYKTKTYTRPLFAAPPAAPAREWQDLSPLELRDTLRNCAASTFDKLAPHWYEVRQFAHAIESALKGKNHG